MNSGNNEIEKSYLQYGDLFYIIKSPYFFRKMLYKHSQCLNFSHIIQIDNKFIDDNLNFIINLNKIDIYLALFEKNRSIFYLYFLPNQIIVKNLYRILNYILSCDCDNILREFINYMKYRNISISHNTISLKIINCGDENDNIKYKIYDIIKSGLTDTDKILNVLYKRNIFCYIELCHQMDDFDLINHYILSNFEKLSFSKSKLYSYLLNIDDKRINQNIFKKCFEYINDISSYIRSGKSLYLHDLYDVEKHRCKLMYEIINYRKIDDFISLCYYILSIDINQYKFILDIIMSDYKYYPHLIEFINVVSSECDNNFFLKVVEYILTYIFDFEDIELYKLLCENIDCESIIGIIIEMIPKNLIDTNSDFFVDVLNEYDNLSILHTIITESNIKFKKDCINDIIDMLNSKLCI